MKTDLFIYDATPSGILAAIAAAGEGLDVILATEDAHIGGMQTSGLGLTNTGQRVTIGGLAREFFRRIHRYYVQTWGEDSAQAAACSDGFRFEPHVAELVYETWLKEAGVKVIKNAPLVSVHREGTSIRSVTLHGGSTIAAKVYLDASYEGDLFAAASCSYTLGREASSQYAESLAGVRFPPERVGQADKAIQAYDYRLCLCEDPQNQVPFTKPAGYDPKTYHWHYMHLLHNPPKTLHAALPVNPMPNRKTDSRTGEWVGASWDWPEATLEERKKIALAHANYSAGYIWFLLHDAKLPAVIKTELERWGLAKDEFVDNNHWPWHIYVREARRLVGDWVMTQKDVTFDRFKADGVALGCFFLDVHAVQMVPDPNDPAGVTPEGYLGALATRPYEIPLRAMLPKRSDATNLMASVCVSVSHVAYSTIRVEPAYMLLGHAAGIAAAVACKKSVPVQDVDAQAVRARLLEQNQILDASQHNEFWPNNFIRVE